MKTRIAAFVSIPKNASKTVLKVLELGLNRNLDVTDSPVIYENHQRGSVLASRYRLDELFVFCFSRHPLDRCVSWYYYHRSILPYSNYNFAEWVEAGMPHHWKRQNQTDYQKSGITPLLQSNFTDDCRIDFVGRVENFRADLIYVVERLNQLSAERGLSRRFRFSDVRENAGGRSSEWAGYFNPRLREMAVSMLRRDFERFGYDT